VKQTFEYGKYSYEYYVELAERKTLGLEVLPDLRIIAKVPFDATLDEIEAFLVRKWRWLDKQLTELGKMRKSRIERQYISGESYHYLGRQYMLLVEQGTRDVVKMERGKLRLYTTKSTRNSAHNERLLREWYGYHRDRVFKQEYLKALERFDYSEIPLLGQRAMTRRWGSYTSDGRILLNPRLIEAPREAIHYVCVHELCHKISRKHDDIFYLELKKRLPGWKLVKNSLELRYG